VGGVYTAPIVPGVNNSVKLRLSMQLINEPYSKRAFSLRQHGTFLPLMVIFARGAKNNHQRI
jgi:hypothetical protein